MRLTAAAILAALATPGFAQDSAEGRRIVSALSWLSQEASCGEALEAMAGTDPGDADAEIVGLLALAMLHGQAAALDITVADATAGLMARCAEDMDAPFLTIPD